MIKERIEAAVGAFTTLPTCPSSVCILQIDNASLFFFIRCSSLNAPAFSGSEAAEPVIKLAHSYINHCQPGQPPHPPNTVLHLPEDPNLR